MISGWPLTQTSSVLPGQPGILPLEFNTGNSGQEMHTRNFSGTDIISTLLGPGCTRVLQHNPG